MAGPGDGPAGLLLMTVPEEMAEWRELPLLFCENNSKVGETTPTIVLTRDCSQGGGGGGQWRSRWRSGVSVTGYASMTKHGVWYVGGRSCTGHGLGCN